MFKVFIFVFTIVLSASSSPSEECHCVNDSYGNYGCYTVYGESCGPSRSRKSSGVDIGQMIVAGIFILLGYSYFTNTEKERQKTKARIEAAQKEKDSTILKCKECGQMNKVLAEHKGHAIVCAKCGSKLTS